MASTITLTVSQQMLEKMYQHYTNQIIKVPNHTLFQAKTTHCTITAYLSKKVVFQGKAPEVEAQKWQTPPQAATTKAKTSSSKLPENIASLSAIGCDEVGTGDYFGPLVVCCAYVPEELISKLQAMGIKDSKALKDPEICHLAEQIEPLIAHQVLILPNEKYNTITEPEALSMCIKDTVTDGKGMGFGLYSTSLLARDAGLRFEIRSGKYTMKVQDNIEFTKENEYWQGTIVYLQLRTNKEINPSEVVANRTNVIAQYNETFLNDNELTELW